MIFGRNKKIAQIKKELSFCPDEIKQENIFLVREVREDFLYFWRGAAESFCRVGRSNRR